MLLTLSVSASLLNPLSILTITITRKVIFKFISALKLWLVYTDFFAIILLHVLILCSKNCSLVSIFDVLHTSSIISFMKTLIRNQFIQLIDLFLYFILMVQLTFLKSLFTLLSFLYATPRFLPQRRAPHNTNGCRPRTTDDRKEGPEAL